MKFNNTSNSQLERVYQDYYIDRSAMLGQGSSGEVYKGVDHQKRQIAIKIIDTRNWNDKLEREIKVMQILRQKKHPNLLPLYDYFRNKARNQLYLFLEHCPNTLEKMIKEQEISKQTAYKYLREMTSGLFYMHKLGYFHRDISPKNILIDSQGVIKIADFGIARQIENQVKYTQKKGTPLYSAPEVVLKLGYNEKCDMFSLGCIHFEMLTKKSLNPKQIRYEHQLEKHYQQIMSGKEKFDLKDPNLNEADRLLISQMIQVDTQKRLTFEELRNRLHAFEQNRSFRVAKRPQHEEKEQSMQGLNSIKKRFQFRQRRCNYLLNVLKIIHKNQHLPSKFIPRIYKLALIFFSLVKYCFSTTELIVIAVKQNLAMNQNPQQIEQLVRKLTPEDQQHLILYLKELSQRILVKQTSIKRFMKQQIMSKIMAVFEDPHPNQQKSFANQLKFTEIFPFYKPNILQSLIISEEKEPQEIVDFKDKYQICLNNLFRTPKELRQLSNEDLAIYLALFNVHYLEQLAKSNKDDFPPSVEEICSLSREALIDKIKHFQLMSE